MIERVQPMASQPDPVRMGIVGVGALTLRAVLPHLTETDVAPLVRVTALCDPVVDRGMTDGRRHGRNPSPKGPSIGAFAYRLG